MPVPPRPSQPEFPTRKQHHESSPYTGTKTRRMTHRSSLSGGGGGAVPAPSHKPPSTFHSFKGDLKTQDIFVDVIEAHRRSGQKFRVLFPGSDRFEMERLDMWNHDSICTPCLILQPKTPSDVSSCIRGYTSGVRRCLKENRRTGTKRGVPRLCVSGGRNSFSCMKEGAIVLDLSRMRDVTVDEENRTVTVQGGARILDLDSTLGEYGLMAVSGTFQNLGVVGCLLGGGLGYASGKHGLASDNLLAAEIVLADGRLKRCSATKHEDLYWSLRGGGGGIGVVTSVTLRCYPLRNAALLTFDLTAPSVLSRRKLISQWGNWICGDMEGMKSGTDNLSLSDIGGAPQEVYSQLVLPTNSTSISCISTSIDPEVVPQSEGRLEQFRDMMKKKNRRGPLGLFGGRADQKLPTSWDRVPGLAELRTNKFGAAVRSNSNFRMVRYWDELQAFGGKFYQPGNVFLAYKYVTALSGRILNVLAQATAGEASPHNDSRILISCTGNSVTDFSKQSSAFDAREMKYLIFLEGRWNESDSEARDLREKKKVIDWVHLVSNQLHFCEGVRSTSHPESTRDQVSKSGRSDPPAGWYNFGEENGRRLAWVKQKRDPRNVFSLASRISWKMNADPGKVDRVENSSNSKPPSPPRTLVDNVIKEGEVCAGSCFTLNTFSNNVPSTTPKKNIPIPRNKEPREPQSHPHNRTESPRLTKETIAQQSHRIAPMRNEVMLDTISSRSDGLERQPSTVSSEGLSLSGHLERQPSDYGRNGVLESINSLESEFALATKSISDDKGTEVESVSLSSRGSRGSRGSKQRKSDGGDVSPKQKRSQDEGSNGDDEENDILEWRSGEEESDDDINDWSIAPIGVAESLYEEDDEDLAGRTGVAPEC